MNLYFGPCRFFNLLDMLLNAAKSILWAMFLLLPTPAKVTSHKSSFLDFQLKCCSGHIGHIANALCSKLHYAKVV